MTAHHSCGQDCTQRVRQVLAHDVRCRSVDWLVQCSTSTMDADGKKPDRTRDNSTFVGQDIAEQVCCNDNIKLCRIYNSCIAVLST